MKNSRMLRVLLILMMPVLFATSLHAQPAPDSTGADAPLADSTLADAYRVFRADGQAVTLDDVLAAMNAVDVIFIGEHHDDPVAHYLQAELLTQTYARQAQNEATRPMALSLEMFERDVQLILDEYLADLITETHFLRSSRPWKNYETDYRPMVEFAKAHAMPVLAANAPRRYVNRVSRKGPASLDSLTVWGKSWLPPLPYPGPSPAYKAKWDRLMAEMMAPKKDETPPADSTVTHTPNPKTPTPEAQRADTIPTPRADTTATHAAAQEDEKKAPPMTHGPSYMLDAQALWDATMAYSIYQHLLAAPGALVLHMAGSFHVEGGLGTPAQLEGFRPGTRHLVVVIKATDDFASFDAEEHGHLGDFIIQTDKSLPRSYEASFGQ